MITFFKDFLNENYMDYFDFNVGDCYIYAIAQHRVTGYPLFVVNLYFKEDDWEELDDGEWAYDHETAHVVVKAPNGKYLDHEGEYDEESLKELCKTNYTEFIKIEPVSEFEARTSYLGSDETETIGLDYREEDIKIVEDGLKKEMKIQ